MAKTREQLEGVFDTVLAKLPKYIARGRVTLRRDLSTQASLRVSLDGALVSEFVYGQFGWCPYESSAGHNDPRASAAVLRAMRAAMKVHP